MAAKKARKRAYIPPSNEVVNRRERAAAAPRVDRTQRAAQQQRGGKAFVPPKPSIGRTLKRLPLYFVLIFALQYWFAGQNAKDADTMQRLLIASSSAAFVTIMFAPFMHVMDRFAYNRHLRRAGLQPDGSKQSGTKQS